MQLLLPGWLWPGGVAWGEAGGVAWYVTWGLPCVDWGNLWEGPGGVSWLITWVIHHGREFTAVANQVT